MRKNINKKNAIIGIIGVFAIAVFIIGINRLYGMLNSPHKEALKDNASKTDSKKILNVTSVYTYAFDISNSKILADISDYIAIIKIDTIDGVSNKNNLTGKYFAHPYTYVTATVLNVLKGDISTPIINYVRLGGSIPYDEWIKGDVDPNKMEIIRRKNGLSNVSTKNIMVNYKVENDIEIEMGKTYLVYMIQNPSNEYNIRGVQYGLREVQEDGLSTNSLSSIKIKNNDTGNWEDLSEVVKLYQSK